MKTTLTAIALTCSFVLVTACDSDSNDAASVSIDEIKSNYVEMAYAAYSDSLRTAIDLQTAVNTFVAEPTELNLANARSAYKAARAPYQESEIMRWDSSLTVGQGLDSDGGPASVDAWEGQVNAWPLDENHIVSLIQGSEVINTQLLLDQNGIDGEGNEEEANVTTGVHAIEFMLWGEDTHGTEAGAGERIALDYDADNCADNYCQRRADYLITATDLVVNDLTEMKAEWSPAAVTASGSLAHNFINSELALSYMIGSMYAMAIDELAGARMNSGLTLGDPEEEHDCFSDLSHIAIYHNFQGVKNAFYGHYGNVSGASIADLVNEADTASHDRIDTLLVSIEEKMYAIYQAGERTDNPVKFDQIIGQDATGAERKIAEAAVVELLQLDSEFKGVIELLALQDFETDSADGD